MPLLLATAVAHLNSIFHITTVVLCIAILLCSAEATARDLPSLDKPLVKKPEPAEPTKPPAPVKKPVPKAEPSQKPSPATKAPAATTRAPRPVVTPPPLNQPLSPDKPTVPVPMPSPAPEPRKIPPPATEGPPAPPPASPPAPLNTSPITLVTGTNMAARTDVGPRDSEELTFRKFTVSPQVGYAYFHESSYRYDGLLLRVDHRNAFTVRLHLDVGGDGFAMEVAPLFAVEQAAGEWTIENSDVGVGAKGRFYAAGGQLNVVYRFTAGRFYPHLGFGFHGASIFGENIQYGAELYGRIPLGFTAYISEAIGFVLEGAFLYGVTGIRGRDPDTEQIQQDLLDRYGIDLTGIDWNSTTPDELQARYDLTDAEVQDIVDEQIGQSIQFGQGWAVEINIGLRFP